MDDRMCVTPRPVYVAMGGQFREYLVACRYCWQCKSRRVYDWVGRAIAENETATTSFFVTLTYGRTDRYGEVLDERARSLHYPDVQKWLKRMRKKHDVRYIVTGEYGPLKGRAHWHALLFFRGPAPDVKLDFKYWGNREFNSDPFWKDGHTMWKAFAPEHAKYVCKYMLKAEEGQLTKAMLSKKPPIGHEHFMRRAEQYVEQGLSPQDLEYSFPEVTYGKKNATPRRFTLQGVSADNFLAHFIMKWREKHGRDNWPYSEPVEELLDREARPARELLSIELEDRSRADRARPPQKPDWLPVEVDQLQHEFGAEVELRFDERRKLWLCSLRGDFAAMGEWMFNYDDRGFPAWRSAQDREISSTTAARMRAEYVSRLRPPEFRVGRRPARDVKSP